MFNCWILAVGHSPPAVSRPGEHIRHTTNSLFPSARKLVKGAAGHQLVSQVPGVIPFTVTNEVSCLRPKDGRMKGLCNTITPAAIVIWVSIQSQFVPTLCSSLHWADVTYLIPCVKEHNVICSKVILSQISRNFFNLENIRLRWACTSIPVSPLQEKSSWHRF